MPECNTILSAYTLYRHLGKCYTHSSVLHNPRRSVPKERPSVCSSIRPSVRPFVLPKPFLHEPWTEFDKTLYTNSLGYYAAVVFPFDALSWEMLFLAKFHLLLTSYSVFVSISRNFMVILSVKSFTMCLFL